MRYNGFKSIPLNMLCLLLIFSLILTVSGESSSNETIPDWCEELRESTVYLNQTWTSTLAIEDLISPVDQCPIDLILEPIESIEFEPNFDLNQTLHVDHINQTFEIFSRLLELNENFTHSVEPLTRRIMAQLSFLFYELEFSPPCLESLAVIAQAIRNNEFWALKCKSIYFEIQLLICTCSFGCKWQDSSWNYGGNSHYGR